MSDSVHQVTADQFLALRDNVSIPVHEKLKEKHEFLLKSFSCFTCPAPANIHSTFHAKHKKNRNEFKGNRTEKVKIGCRDLSRENFGRKDFMALMNKMTNANKDTILQSIRNAYRDDCQSIYTEITWSMMQKSSEFHDLHWSVIDAIRDATCDRAKWQDSWKDIAKEFIVEQKWIPALSIVQSDDYDEFCDFVKWRKSTVAAIRALCMLEDKEWIELSFRNTISEAIMEKIRTEIADANTIGDKVTDALIEQLHTIVTITNKRSLIAITSQWFQSHIQDILPRLRPATRFKMYDLSELVERKMKIASNT